MADFAEALTKLSEVLMPSGTMLPFAGKSIPDGWLLCNGAAVSRTTYADLFSAIGTAWGEGDGSTTFNLPNCDSRFMEGTTDASKVGTYLEAGLPNITGEFGCAVPGGHDEYATGAFGGVTVASAASQPIAKTFISSTLWGYQINTSWISSVYGGSSTIQPPSIYTLIIIKV